VTQSSLVRLRLRNQWLVGTARRTPLDVVEHLGAVQSQEFGPATWALGLRATGLLQADVIRAFDAGEIVRTHVLRPTWHFVPPRDLRWMLALTAPRLRAAARRRFAALGLDDDVVARSRRSMERALAAGIPLTRPELAERMRRDGLVVEGQQVYHLTFDAELEGLVCSGPVRDRQFTYDLLDRRVPAAPAIERDEALSVLARRYFTSHGPATLHDFAWWSGLAMGEVRRAVGILGSELAEVEVGGATCVLVPARLPAPPVKPVAHLVPCFDEYTVAYRDRRAVAGPSGAGDPPGALLVDLVILNGLRVGTWRRSAGGGAPAAVALSRRLTRTEKEAVNRAIERYRAFVQD
jgi:hypothetical protein